MRIDVRAQKKNTDMQMSTHPVGDLGAVVVHMRVDHRVLIESQGHGLHDERQVREVNASRFGDGLELLTQFHQGRHVELVAVGKVRNLRQNTQQG